MVATKNAVREIPKRQPDEVVPLGQNTMAELLKKPLRMLPAPVRPTVLKIWCMYKHLQGFESSFSLCSCLSVWIAEHKLQQASIIAILEKLTHPSVMAKFNFGNQLIQHIATEASEELRRIKTLTEASQRRKEAEESKQQPRPTLKFSDFGKMPTEGASS
jgi:hypothetical protein